MKAFCLLISILFANFTIAQEQEWYDAEGNVVRVTKKADNNEPYTPRWLEKENNTPEIYQWRARTIHEYRTSSRGRTIYYGPYWGGYNYCRPYYRYSSSRVPYYGGYRGFYGSSYGGYLGYRGSNFGAVIRW